MTAKCTCRIEFGPSDLFIEHCPLCASAPELLEACKGAFKLPRPWTEGGIEWSEWDKAFSLIDAAISHAETPMKGEPK